MKGNETRTARDVQAGAGMAAVIELGTTSIRMTIAQIRGKRSNDALDRLQQSVSLGRDTFTQGFIGAETTERCVSALNSFRRVLAEYGITDDDRITVVASSAVREAANRDAFIDRILIATGLDVRIVDQAEVNRFTYLAVRPIFSRVPSLKKGTTMVLEVGGGSTEALVFHAGRVASAHLYPLGSLRVRRMLADYRAPHARTPEIIREHVDRTVDRIASTPAHDSLLRMLVLGNDARFACSVLAPAWDRRAPAKLRVRDLAALTDTIAGETVDEVVKRYGLTYPDAETLAPALLMYSGLAKTLHIKHVLVGGASLRDGILAEIASEGSWTADFRRQIISSALELAKRFGVDIRHAKRAAKVSRAIFDALREEHRLGARHEIILHAACLLHDAGQFISRSSHHKHSQYLISNSELFGLSANDVLLASLVARYHRRALPKMTHVGYGSLSRDDRIVVCKLAAILRIANILSRPRIQLRGGIKIDLEPGRLVVAAECTSDWTLEQHAVHERANMFKQVYGRDVVLRNAHRGS